MMKNVIPVFAVVLFASAFTAASPATAAGRRICRGPWMLWGLVVPGSRLGEFRVALRCDYGSFARAKPARDSTGSRGSVEKRS